MSDSIINSAISNTEEQLESVTEKRLEKVFNESTPSSAVESQISTPESNAESAVSTQESVTSSLAESAVSAHKDSSAESVASAQAADELVGLPDAYYRAALHQEWTEKDVKEFYKKDPELAKKTFAKIYESTNKLSQEFAAAGRARLEQQQKSQKPKEKKEEQQEESSKFKGIDIAKLRKQYDDDPIVDMVEAQQKQNKMLFDEVQKLGKGTPDKPQVDEQQLRIQIQEEALMEQQIDLFFKAEDMKIYSELYGDGKVSCKQWNTLTSEQQTNRLNLVEAADQIITGAENQGRKMNISEAMDLAHLIVSEPVREKAIRKDIKAQLKKRSKGRTLPPDGKKVVENDGKPKSEKELEAVTAQRITEAFSKKKR